MKTPKSFEGGFFQFHDISEGFYPVSIFVDKKVNDGDILMSFGDFNNDTFTDFVTINSAGTSIYLYVWNKNTFSFDQNVIV